MGDRVIPSKPADLTRAAHLKKALESGAPPAFVTSDGATSPDNRPDPEPVGLPLPLSEAVGRQKHTPETRLQFLEQVFQGSPDALVIADREHRALWANETFARMFGY